MSDAMPSYVPSGQVSVGRLYLAGLVGVVACAALGWVYQLAQQNVPLLWFACLYTLAAALLVAVLAGLLSRAAHVRSRRAALVLGAALGLAAVAGSFLAAFASFADGAYAGDRSTVTFLQYLDARIDAGWMIGRLSGGRELAGPCVIAAWSAEAALLIYAGARGALPGVYAPYCEGCGRYARPQFTLARAVDASALRVASARGRLDALIAIPPSQSGGRLAFYEVRACPGCRRAWLDVRIESAGDRLSAGGSMLPLPIPIPSELLGACAASLAALGRSPAARSSDHPIRVAVLDDAQVWSLRSGLSEGAGKPPDRE